MPLIHNEARGWIWSVVVTGDNHGCPQWPQAVFTALYGGFKREGFRWRGKFMAIASNGGNTPILRRGYSDFQNESICQLKS
jgi:hypothetical protein